jgi:hypothetical protein
MKHIFFPILYYSLYIHIKTLSVLTEERGYNEEEGTMLQAGKSRVQDPKR